MQPGSVNLEERFQEMAGKFLTPRGTCGCDAPKPATVAAGNWISMAGEWVPFRRCDECVPRLPDGSIGFHRQSDGVAVEQTICARWSGDQGRWVAQVSMPGWRLVIVSSLDDRCPSCGDRAVLVGRVTPPGPLEARCGWCGVERLVSAPELVRLADVAGLPVSVSFRRLAEAEAERRRSGKRTGSAAWA